MSSSLPNHNSPLVVFKVQFSYGISVVPESLLLPIVCFVLPFEVYVFFPFLLLVGAWNNDHLLTSDIITDSEEPYFVYRFFFPVLCELLFGCFLHNGKPLRRPKSQDVRLPSQARKDEVEVTVKVDAAGGQTFLVEISLKTGPRGKSKAQTFDFDYHNVDHSC
ncbi:hypothetical protein SADUNF_Sadunf16G0017200 [Salix dunnii]|uniref:Uncharacterized protein n=1 Tax=Salix dunnii TaxID=1413687 RepID=A0A835J7W4_9ROSI|nr:hypothetical protein SADUNF_Sadunf16G0017200 [Salix dunnii]